MKASYKKSKIIFYSNSESGQKFNHTFFHGASVICDLYHEKLDKNKKAWQKNAIDFRKSLAL